MTSRTWDSVLDILESLITFKQRADGKGWRDAFENMPIYIERAGLREDIKKLSVIHVAGTKGKGSTCAMVESMLRSSGFRTGLFTSPHLVDVRERIRINGQMVPRDVFQRHFWQLFDSLQASATPEVGVPGYFRFITLLGLRIFAEQGVDVAILEVGLGGRLDATNVVAHPVVCGITALGMDHVELLGDTLPKIAAEKAGIMKRGSPVHSAPQPEDAMAVLQVQGTDKLSCHRGGRRSRRPPLCERNVIRLACPAESKGCTAPQPVHQQVAAGFRAAQTYNLLPVLDPREAEGTAARTGGCRPETHLLPPAQEVAAQTSTSLSVPVPLAEWRTTGGGHPVSALAGAHQADNAALAVQLAFTWEARSQVNNAGSAKRLAQLGERLLPAEYSEGLARVVWPGRSQVVHDEEFTSTSSSNCEKAAQGVSSTSSTAAAASPGACNGHVRAENGTACGAGIPSSGTASTSAGSSRLSFYLDGAHTPESMVTCGQWFADALAMTVPSLPAARSPEGPVDLQVMIFNCMRERDGAKLLPPLADTLALRGVSISHAVFVPPESQYGSLRGSTATAAGASAAPGGAPALLPPPSVDVSWQEQLATVWEAQLAAGAVTRQQHRAPGGSAANRPLALPFAAAAAGAAPGAAAHSSVSPSLHATIDWLRTCVRQSPRLRMQVLVTGSLYLVGDMLRLLNKPPQ